MPFVDEAAPSAATGGGKFVDESPAQAKGGSFVDAAPAASVPPQASQSTPPPTAPHVLAPAPQSGGAPHTFPNPLAGVHHDLSQGFLNLQKTAMHASQGPMNAFDAVLGGLQRYSSGVLTYTKTPDFQERFAGKPPLERLQQGVIPAVLGHGIDEMTHPLNQGMQGKNIKDLMDTLGFTKVNEAYDAYIGKEREVVDSYRSPVISRANNATGEAAKGGLRLLTTLLAQSLTDPLMVAGPLSAAARSTRALETIVGSSHVIKVLDQASKGAKGVLKATRLEQPIAKMQAGAHAHVDRVFTPLVNETRVVARKALQAGAWQFGRRPELNEFLDDTGKAGRLGIEQKVETGLGKSWKKEDEALVEKNEQAIRNADKAMPGTDPYPADVRRRLQVNAWRWGTADMRQALEKREGFVPTAEDYKVVKQQGYDGPPGVLDFNIVSKYVPTIKGESSFAQEYDNLLQSLDKRWGKDKVSPFEKIKKTEGGFKDDPIKVMNRRLAIERYIIQRRLVDRETEKFLTDHGGWIGKGAPDATKLTHEANPYGQGTGTGKIVDYSKFGGATLGRIAAQGVVANPLPHAKNLSELAFLSGGPKAFGAGMAYSAHGLNDAQLMRLQNMGGLPSEYAAGMKGPIAAVGGLVSKVPKVGKRTAELGEGYLKNANKVLDRVEMGMRQALLDHYDEMMGPSKSIADEYKKADLIRRDLGDYRNVSMFIKGLQAIGGPFVAFRMGAVPGAVGRAMLKNPGRVESLVRPQVDENEDPDLGGKLPFVSEFTGPVHDMAEMTMNPLNYFSSPSTLGPVLGNVATELLKLSRGQGVSLDSAVMGTVEQQVPGLGFTELFTHAAYGQTPGVSLLRSSLDTAFGNYTHKRPNARRQQREDNYMMRTQ
jgi:hypothetical protein